MIILVFGYNDYTEVNELYCKTAAKSAEIGGKYGKKHDVKTIGCV